MFTRHSLRQLSNANSFARGQDLYDEGSLSKLRREGDSFLASVQGSRSYRVVLRLAATGLVFTCNCPYDWDGICKHSVALGLAVLDAYLPTDLLPSTQNAPAASSQLAADVNTAWAARKKGEKLLFLKHALAKSDDLARQFLGFGGVPAPTSDADLLANLPARLTEALEALEFDEQRREDSESYYDEDDEGGGLLEAAEDLLRDTLAPFVAELVQVARAGQLTTALRYWATANAAIFRIEEPANDDYGTFGHYGTDVLQHWHADLAAADWPQVLLAAVMPPAELKAALHWLGQYLARPASTWPEFEDSWRPLLLSLAADLAAAPLLAAALEPAQLRADTRAHLRLQLARTLPDDAAWAQAAETLLPTDAAVARQLLNHYAAQADRPRLLRAATTAFATWPDRFADYVLATFTPALAPDLFRTALRHRALANQSREDFTRLRPMLTPSAIADFVGEAVAAVRGRSGGVAFAAELLAAEADAATLRGFVLGLEWITITPTHELGTALTRLAEADPTSLMLELEGRTRAYLHGRANAKRGAVLYQAIGRWLALVRTAAPRLTEPVLRLAQELRQEFPTLHGLKDSLKRQGLLVDKPVLLKEPARPSRKPDPNK